ncbi:50S ribosomal protein L20 [Nitrospinae bacterium AH_259_B05_G02_I21]|nr:50S ribosomal protein L20 [Nitrospinae bacterium AH_259_B05_G02_I21]
MTRATSGPTTRRRHKKIIKQAKGYYGMRRTSYRRAREAVERALKYAYRDRRQRKRQFRRLWVVRINAAARLNGLTYGQLIHGLKRADVALDRKVLAHLAVHDPEAFGQIAERAKAALAA